MTLQRNARTAVTCQQCFHTIYITVLTPKLDQLAHKKAGMSSENYGCQVILSHPIVPFPLSTLSLLSWQLGMTNVMSENPVCPELLCPCTVFPGYNLWVIHWFFCFSRYCQWVIWRCGKCGVKNSKSVQRLSSSKEVRDNRHNKDRV